MKIRFASSLFTLRQVVRMKYYAVANGRKKGVYTTWDTAEAQVKGYKGAVYKSFKDRDSANEFAANGRYKNSDSISSNGGGGGGGSIKSKYSDIKSNYIDVLPYSISKSRDASGNTNYNGSSIGKENNDNCTKLLSSTQTPKKIYTDGAARNNGRANVIGGIGVFFGFQDSRNIARAFDEVDGNEPPTNQKAELHAVCEALKIIYKEVSLGSTRPYIILTDSQYTINSMGPWAVNWEKNGYKNAKNQTIANKEVIQKSRHLLRAIKKKGGDVEFEHVRGHSGDYGNEMADKLANEGADAMNKRT